MSYAVIYTSTGSKANALEISKLCDADKTTDRELWTVISNCDLCDLPTENNMEHKECIDYEQWLADLTGYQ